MKKRITIALLLGVVLGIHAQKKPNIIYILADDLGYGDVSCFNENSKIKTPHLDQLASEGMKFTDAHSSAANCTPTRYGIMTGRYTFRTWSKKGVLSGRSVALIPKSRSTVASVLKKNGYETSLIGKWHLGWNWASKSGKKLKIDSDISGKDIDYSKPVTNSPNDLGFDYFYSICGSADMAPYVYVENGKTTKVITGEIKAGQGLPKELKKYAKFRSGPIAKDFTHEDILPDFINRANDYIKKKKDSDKPFFLYLPLTSPHTPIIPNKDWLGKSGINPYADFVMMTDHLIGQVLNTVKEAGIEDNTLIIFTADNGASPSCNFKVLGQKGHNPSYIYAGRKTSIYEGGHREPFIVKWPAKVEAGTTCTDIVCTTDLMATCADIVDYKLKDNEGEDSYSMMPLFEQKELKTPLREATIHRSSGGFLAIRQGKWKLIFAQGSGSQSEIKNYKIDASKPLYQLYDLEADPSETKNVVKQHPSIVENLRALMIKYIEEGRSTPGKPQKNDPELEPWKQVETIFKG